MIKCLPWTNNANTYPWTTNAQNIYIRSVTLSRINSVAGTTDVIGNAGYSGAELGVGIEGETILFTGLPASIQLGAAGRTNKGTELPGDAIARPVWNIFIPATAIAQYSVRDRDIIIDDEGYRYMVGANYWTQLGYQLSTIRQEA